MGTYTKRRKSYYRKSKRRKRRTRRRLRRRLSRSRRRRRYRVSALNVRDEQGKLIRGEDRPTGIVTYRREGGKNIPLPDFISANVPFLKLDDNYKTFLESLVEKGVPTLVPKLEVFP